MAAQGTPKFYVFDSFTDENEVANVTIGLYPKKDSYTYGEFSLNICKLEAGAYRSESDYLVLELSGPEGLRAFNDKRINPVVQKMIRKFDKKDRFTVEDVKLYLEGHGIPCEGDQRRNK